MEWAENVARKDFSTFRTQVGKTQPIFRTTSGADGLQRFFRLFLEDFWCMILSQGKA